MTDEEFAKIEKDYADWLALPAEIEKMRKASEYVATQWLTEDYDSDARRLFERDFPKLLAEVKRLRQGAP
jgi:hypothetical protein